MVIIYLIAAGVFIVGFSIWYALYIIKDIKETNDERDEETAIYYDQ